MIVCEIIGFHLQPGLQDKELKAIFTLQSPKTDLFIYLFLLQWDTDIF